MAGSGDPDIVSPGREVPDGVCENRSDNVSVRKQKVPFWSFTTPDPLTSTERPGDLVDEVIPVPVDRRATRGPARGLSRRGFFRMDSCEQDLCFAYLFSGWCGVPSPEGHKRLVLGTVNHLRRDMHEPFQSGDIFHQDSQRNQAGTGLHSRRKLAAASSWSDSIPVDVGFRCAIHDNIEPIEDLVEVLFLQNVTLGVSGTRPPQKSSPTGGASQILASVRK